MRPLGIRNNNPLNIRYSPMNNWRGQIGSNHGFCQFDTMEHGFRAAIVLLHNYVKRGYDNVYEIISRWAPKSENDTKAYIRTVVAHFNGYVEPDYKYLTLTTQFPKDDLEALLPFIYELAWIMALYECGYANVGDDWPEEVKKLSFAWISACNDYSESHLK